MATVIVTGTYYHYYGGSHWGAGWLDHLRWNRPQSKDKINCQIWHKSFQEECFILFFKWRITLLPKGDNSEFVKSDIRVVKKKLPSKYNCIWVQIGNLRDHEIGAKVVISNGRHLKIFSRTTGTNWDSTKYDARKASFICDLEFLVNAKTQQDGWGPFFKCLVLLSFLLVLKQTMARVSILVSYKGTLITYKLIF